MREKTQRGLGSKEQAGRMGRWLLWAGAAVFAVESWFLIGRAVAFWQGSGAMTLGWMAAVGVAAQKVLSLVVWNEGLLLATMAKVLVLCCPLLVIAVGMQMVRQANAVEVEESAADAPAAEETRR